MSNNKFNQTDLPELDELSPEDRNDLDYISELIKLYVSAGHHKSNACIKLRIHLGQLLEDEQERLNTTPELKLPLLKNNKPIDHTDNWRALFNYYGTHISYNEMSKDVVVLFAPDRAPKDGKNILITAYNDNKNVVVRHIKNDAVVNNLTISTCEDHMGVIAKENRHHPVKQWLEQQVWDGITRLDDFVNIFTLVDKDDHDNVKMYCTKWLIQAVAALYRRDFVTQGVLSLLGGQGLKKSTFLRSIVPNNEWVATGLIVDPHNKDDVIKAISYWIIELGEVDAMFRKTDIAAIKNWITQEYDELRLPYDKQPVKYKRQTVAIATVNETDFLNDDENRRWWVIHLQSININHNIDLGQLWAEAKVLFDKGTPQCH